MNEKIAVVVTSIAGANRVLQDLAKGCTEKDYQFVVIGDEGSPADFDLDRWNRGAVRRAAEGFLRRMVDHRLEHVTDMQSALG